MGRADRNDAPGVGVDGFIDLAESVQAVGFAYAYDDDDNGVLDFLDFNGNGVQDRDGPDYEPTLWAVDSNADGRLDTNLDTTGPGGRPDGVIDSLDAVGGVPFAPTVGVDRIGAVKVWLLGRTKNEIPGHTETATYVVADRHITPNDHFRRRLLTATIRCRNLPVKKHD